MNTPISCLVVFLIFPVFDASVITFIKNKKITCILTGEHRDRTVYLKSSPEVQFRKLEIVKIDQWLNEDWNEHPDNSSLFFYPLMNQQWHDISILNKSYDVDFNNRSIGFAVCTKEDFSLIFKDSTITKNQTITVENNQNETEFCFWRHFQLNVIKDKIEMDELKYNKSIDGLTRVKLKAEQMNFTARNFSFKNSSLVFWKLFIDNPLYFWSNQSISDIFPKFSIPLGFHHGHKCISFFTSIDKGCALDFQLECDDGHIKKYSKSGFNPPQGDREWRKVNLSIECNTWGKLYFSKTRNVDSNNTFGFWAITNVQYEDCYQHKEIWTANLPNLVLENDNQNRCSLLDSPIHDSEDCEKSGYYGTKCEFNCSEIETDAECKGYRICQGNSLCKCGFGWSGEFCNETCVSGRWGRSCEQKCSCSYCNKFNGECMSTISSTDSTTGFEKPIIANSSFNVTTSIASKSESTSINPLIKASSEMATTPDIQDELNKASSYIFSALIIVVFIGSITGFFLYKKFRKGKYSHHINLNSEIEMSAIGTDSNIQLNDLDGYLQEELTKENNRIHQQFLRLQTDGKKSCHIGLAQRNRNRNRERDFLPSDHSRVVRKKMHGMDSNDYINASYIENNIQDRAFIATQAPKFSTVQDFWRMIWQEEVKLIIMLVNFKEFGKRKCAEYWCDQIDQDKVYGQISVRLIAHKPGEYFHRRRFELSYGLHKLTVQHFQLNYQPESGQPLYVNNVAALLQNVEKTCYDSGRPVVVHCSSGSELSGTFILSALALQMAHAFGRMNFFKLAQTMRLQRPNIIANLHNYVLAHMIVSECLIHSKYFENLVEKQQSELNQQIQILDIVSLHDQYVRKCEETPAQTYADVGANKSYKFIIEKQPTRNTVDDFWRTVFSQGIKIIVFLNESLSNYQFLFPIYVQLFSEVDCELVSIQECPSTDSTLF